MALAQNTCDNFYGRLYNKNGNYSEMTENDNSAMNIGTLPR